MQLFPREFELRHGLMLAILLHVLLFVFGRIGSLTRATPVAEAPTPPPLQFVFEPREIAFVDIPEDPNAPDRLPPDERADRPVLSDRDRRARGGQQPTTELPDGDPFQDGQIETRVAGSGGPDLLSPNTPPSPSPSPPQPSVAPTPAVPAQQPSPSEPVEAVARRDLPDGPGARVRTQEQRLEEAREALRDGLRPITRQELIAATPPSSPPSQGKPQFRNLDSHSRFEGNLSFDTEWFEWGEYFRRIHPIIYRAWVSRLPPARRSLSGVSVVHFYINRDGSTASVELRSSYGSRSDSPEVRDKSMQQLNQAAVDTLRGVQLPPLPEDFPFDREGVTAVFIVRPPR